MGRIRYTLLLDCVVKVLKLIKQRYSNIFVGLGFLLDKLGYDPSIGEIQEIGKYLEVRGYVRAVFLLGDVQVQITPSGLVYIENKGEEFKTEFEEFFKQILGDKSVEEFVESFSEPQDDPQAKISQLITRLTSTIIQTEGRGSDYIKDLQILELEISKFKPDFNLIDLKLNNLSAINYIKSQIQELKDYLVIPNS